MSGDDGWNVLGGTHDRTVIDDRGEFVCEARDAQTAALIAALRAKAAAADRVRELHPLRGTTENGYCDGCDLVWPCPTIRTLDGAGQP